MATMKTATVTIPLFGHGLESVGSIEHEPKVTGAFAADTVTGNDGIEYAVFTVIDPENREYPSEWAGQYRISVSKLKAMTTSKDTHTVGIEVVTDEGSDLFTEELGRYGHDDPKVYDPDIFA